MSDPFGEAARTLGPVLVGARGWRAVYAQPDPLGSNLPLLFERDLVAFAHFGVGDERTIEGLDGDSRISSCERFANFVRYLGPGDDLGVVPKVNELNKLYLDACGYPDRPLLRSAKPDDYFGRSDLSEGQLMSRNEAGNPKEAARVRHAVVNALSPGAPYEAIWLKFVTEAVGWCKREGALIGVYCRQAGWEECVRVRPIELRKAPESTARRAVREVERAQAETLEEPFLEGETLEEPLFEGEDEYAPVRDRRGRLARRRPGRRGG